MLAGFFTILMAATAAPCTTGLTQKQSESVRYFLHLGNSVVFMTAHRMRCFRRATVVLQTTGALLLQTTPTSRTGLAPLFLVAETTRILLGVMMETVLLRNLMMVRALYCISILPTTQPLLCLGTVRLRCTRIHPSQALPLCSATHRARPGQATTLAGCFLLVFILKMKMCTFLRRCGFSI